MIPTVHDPSCSILLTPYLQKIKTVIIGTLPVPVAAQSKA
jgi:hypothetical protein